VTAAPTPDVDVVIPVHSLDRPIRRAVSSVFEGSDATDIRVTVVCHGIPEAEVASALAGMANVRMISCDDPFPSAAGPMNAGFDAATAPFVSRLDSDDTFEPGAIDAWMEVARSRGSDIVIAPLRPVGDRIAYAPLTRPFRHRRLDPVRDRVSYRTAPFGLLSAAELRRLGARYTPGMSVGEDLEFGVRVWFGGGRLDLAAHAPAYVVHADAVQRTTGVDRPAAVELAATARLLAQSWFLALGLAERRSIVIKVARIHVLGAVRNRLARDAATEADAAAIAAVVAAFDDVAPGWLSPFNRHDTAVLRLLSDGRLAAASALMKAGGSRGDTLLAPTLRGTLDRESTLRRYLRYSLPR
jgi:hypothetical protein